MENALPLELFSSVACLLCELCCPITCSYPSTCYAVLCLVSQSCLTHWDPMDCSLPGSSVHGDSAGKNTGVGCHALLPGDFPNPGIKPRSRTLQANSFTDWANQGSLRILEWVAYPFSRGSSWPRNQTGSPALQVDSLPAGLHREAHLYL